MIVLSRTLLQKATSSNITKVNYRHHQSQPFHNAPHTTSRTDTIDNSLSTLPKLTSLKQLTRIPSNLTIRNPTLITLNSSLTIRITRITTRLPLTLTSRTLIRQPTNRRNINLLLNVRRPNRIKLQRSLSKISTVRSRNRINRRLTRTHLLQLLRPNRSATLLRINLSHHSLHHRVPQHRQLMNRQVQAQGNRDNTNRRRRQRNNNRANVTRQAIRKQVLIKGKQQEVTSIILNIR